MTYTPIVMKCFEYPGMQHIKACHTLGSCAVCIHVQQIHKQCKNLCSSSDTVCLKNLDTYARLLFIDFSSACNTIIPQQLMEKLRSLKVDTCTWNWILDFLTRKLQRVRVGSQTSTSISVSTGLPQGCELSPLLFTLLNHDSAASISSNHVIKFADNTTVVVLNSQEVEWLVEWCIELFLNVDKTKEMVIDFRKAHNKHQPLIIDGRDVERVSTIKFDDLSKSSNTKAITKKAQE